MLKMKISFQIENFINTSNNCLQSEKEGTTMKNLKFVSMYFRRAMIFNFLQHFLSFLVKEQQIVY